MVTQFHKVGFVEEKFISFFNVNFSTLVGRFGEIRMLDPDASQGALAMWQCSPASAGTLSNEGRLAWAHGVGLGIHFHFSSGSTRRGTTGK